VALFREPPCVLSLSVCSTLQGGNELGQLGDGLNKQRTATEMYELTDLDENIMQVACGSYFSVALSDRSHVFVWGQNVSKKFHSDNMEGFLTRKASSILKPYRLHNGKLSLVCVCVCVCV
jgi:alpha-tubulin suppressor-like RCC1 family protein